MHCRAKLHKVALTQDREVISYGYEQSRNNNNNSEKY